MHFKFISNILKLQILIFVFYLQLTSQKHFFNSLFVIIDYSRLMKTFNTQDCIKKIMNILISYNESLIFES